MSFARARGLVKRVIKPKRNATIAKNKFSLTRVRLCSVRPQTRRDDTGHLVDMIRVTGSHGGCPGDLFIPAHPP